jgi:hypothetical protein
LALDIEFGHLSSEILNHTRLPSEHIYAVKSATPSIWFILYLGWRAGSRTPNGDLWANGHKSTFTLPTHNYVWRIRLFIRSVVTDGATD